MNPAKEYDRKTRHFKANSHRMRFDAYACVARQKRMRMRNLRRGIRILV